MQDKKHYRLVQEVIKEANGIVAYISKGFKFKSEEVMHINMHRPSLT